MDIAGWLRAFGLERYEAAFSENDVDAELLSNLTDDDLKEIGVTSRWAIAAAYWKRLPRCPPKIPRPMTPFSFLLARRAARAATLPRRRPPPNAARSA